MTTVNFKGKPVKLAGELPSAQSPAPNFTYVKEDLSEGDLSDFGDAVKVIIAVPSIDTGVCQAETRKFNEKLASKDARGVVISKDLPFALKRFCATEGIENVSTASDFRGNFCDSYNTTMLDGPLKGLSARVVFVLDKDNTITYVELVPDITEEPDYDRILAEVDKLV